MEKFQKIVFLCGICVEVCPKKCHNIKKEEPLNDLDKCIMCETCGNTLSKRCYS